MVASSEGIRTLLNCPIRGRRVKLPGQEGQAGLPSGTPEVRPRKRVWFCWEEPVTGRLGGEAQPYEKIWPDLRKKQGGLSQAPEQSRLMSSYGLAVSHHGAGICLSHRP